MPARLYFFKFYVLSQLPVGCRQDCGLKKGAIFLQKYFFCSRLKRLTEKNCKKGKTHSVRTIWASSPEVYPATFFDSVILHRFENTEFYIPQNYDLRLKMHYGDYMTPPSEEQRKIGHSIIAFEFGKYSNVSLEINTAG